MNRLAGLSRTKSLLTFYLFTSFIQTLFTENQIMYTFYIHITYQLIEEHLLSLEGGPGGKAGKVGGATGTGNHWLAHILSHSLATTDGLLIAKHQLNR